MQPTYPVLAVHDGRPMADSREVATAFNKLHTHVLAAYRGMHCSPDFRQTNFRPFKTKDLTGEHTSHVLMTKDGFMFLALGFTGAQAGAFKEAFIGRFNAMEEELRRTTVDNVHSCIPQSLPEALRLAADLAEKVERQSAEIAVLEPRSRALAVIADGEGSFCIRDAAKLLDMREKDLRAFLVMDGWIYRRSSLDPWVARSEKLNALWMTTKVVPVDTGSGRPWNRPQARITCAGLVVLAKRLGRPVPPEAQQPLALPAPARA